MLSGGHLKYISSKKPALSPAAHTRDFKWRLLKKNSMCQKSRPICGATLTAINDTVTQTGQEEGRSAVSSARKLLSRSAVYSGTADWQRASGVSCAERERESHVERAGEASVALLSS